MHLPAVPHCPAGALQKAPKRAALKEAHKEALALTKASGGAVQLRHATWHAAWQPQALLLGAARLALPSPCHCRSSPFCCTAAGAAVPKHTAV